MALLKRPIMVVSLGLKSLFMKEAEGATLMHEIREIDPTHPGLCEEYMAALRGDYEPDDLDAANENKSPILKLVCLDGRRLDR